MKMKKLALFSAMFVPAVKGAGASELEDLGAYLSDPLAIDLSETKAPGQNGSFWNFRTWSP